MSANPPSIRDILLTRRGVFVVQSSGPPLAEETVRAVELELAAIGFVLWSRARARLVTCTLDELTGFRAWAIATLLSLVGGGVRHEPLFRRFPDDVPPDTLDLW